MYTCLILLPPAGAIPAAPIRRVAIIAGAARAGCFMIVRSLICRIILTYMLIHKACDLYPQQKTNKYGNTYKLHNTKCNTNPITIGEGQHDFETICVPNLYDTKLHNMTPNRATHNLTHDTPPHCCHAVCICMM